MSSSEHVAARDIALRIGRQHIVQRRPGADVVPAGIERHHDRVLRFLHHRVVDRIAAAGGEDRLVDAREILVAHRAGARARADVRDVGREAARARRESGARRTGTCRSSRSSRPRRRIPCARSRSGFSTNWAIGGRADARVAFAPAEISVTRFRRARDDAEGDELAVLARGNGVC